jgi:hypothetical protein
MSRDAILSWVLGVVAVAVGYVQWGWQGVLLATTLVVFWMLLQFSRALRAMRDAAAAPVGSVASAVMLHAKMQRGMRLTEILRQTHSLGRQVSAKPETFEWTDGSGATVRAEMLDGRLVRWELQRPAEAADAS